MNDEWMIVGKKLFNLLVVMVTRWAPRLKKLINEWMNEWMYEWMNEWINEWMNEWMNERMNEWWLNEWMIGGKKLFNLLVVMVTRWAPRLNKFMNEWMNECMN
jgi:hypothetical protein